MNQPGTGHKRTKSAVGEAQGNELLSTDTAGRTQSTLPAGAAGAGGGTLLVLLANNLPATSLWKSWIVLIVPSASIAISVGFDWLKRYVDRILKQRQLEALIINAKRTLQAALENSQTSEAHRAQLREELEKLELLLVRSSLEKISRSL
jgi:hypothetical protein